MMSPRTWSEAAMPWESEVLTIVADACSVSRRIGLNVLCAQRSQTVGLQPCWKKDGPLHLNL